MRLFLESAFIVLAGRAPHPERRARTHPHFQRPRADSGGWAGQHEGPLRRSVRLDHAGSLSSYIHSLPPLTWYVCVCECRLLNWAGLRRQFPRNFWADPNEFFTDGVLINLGSDFGLMPSLFEPSGVVQQEYFAAGMPWPVLGIQYREVARFLACSCAFRHARHRLQDWRPEGHRVRVPSAYRSALDSPKSL